MTQPACLDQPGIFGAGMPQDVDPDEAAEICHTCPVFDGCLESFAAANRPEHVPYDLTIAGMSGQPLRRAMTMVRERAA